MNDIDLQERYRDMEPVNKMPFLGQIFGCGFQFSKPFEFDAEIASFLTNHCFCLFTVPLFVLGTYRIVETSQGTAVAGREPLPSSAKMRNVVAPIALILIVAGICYWQYTRTEGYKVQQRLANANAYVEAGDYDLAIDAYRQIASKHTKYKTEATKGIQAILSQSLDDAPSEKAVASLKLVSELVQLREFEEKALTPVDHALRLAQAQADSDPATARKLLNAVAGLGTDSKPYQELLQATLEKLVASQPGEAALATELATLYQQQGLWDKCEQLLTPHQDKLGDSEGARILGQVYARSGNFDAGYPLLNGYVESRMKKLHQAERSFSKVRERLIEEAVQRLRSKQAPKELINKLENSRSENRKRDLVNGYIQDSLKGHEELGRARLALMEHAQVVPVATQLGMVVLRRGTRLRDPDARQAELKKAEKIFLSVRGFAEGSSDYQLAFGEILYWLERTDEAQKQFDKFLQTQGRSHIALLRSAQLLRTLGAVTKASQLAEEAFAKAANQVERESAAALRALTSNDIDETIQWLERCDQSNPETQAQLANSKARRAIRNGDTKAADGFLRSSIGIYEKLPETTGSLNNAALEYSLLFSITGDLSALDKRLDLLQRAVKLSPSDGIVLSNVGNATYATGIREAIGESLDLSMLRSTGKLDLLPFLFDDDDGRQSYIAKLKKSARMNKASEFLDQALLIAPKRSTAYEASQQLAYFLGDLDTLKQLLARAEKTNPGEESAIAWKEFMSGKKDKEVLATLTSSLKVKRRVLEVLRNESPSRSFAVAAAQLSNSLRHAKQYGLEIDLEETVKLAEEAYRAVASHATMSSVINAHVFRAISNRAENDQYVAALLKNTRRELNGTQLAVFLLSHDARLREALSDDDDLKRAQEVTRELARKDPHGCGYWEWALLRLFAPAEADKLKGELEVSPLREVNQKLIRKLSPYTTLSDAVRTYHYSELRGNQAAQEDALKTIRAKVPMLK